MRTPWAIALLVLAGCADDRLTLRYVFDPADVPASRVAVLQTHLAPTLPERFLAPVEDQPLEDGLRYTIGCRDPLAADGCTLEMTIEHNASLGFSLTDEFELAFSANPVGGPRRVVVSALARDGDGTVIARAAEIESAFAGATVELVLRDRVRCGVELCTSDEVCCGDHCVDVTRDPRHCGGCDTPCNTGESCVASACRCGDQPGCRGGQLCCGGTTCADLQNDPKHCSACDTACGAGETCQAGACVCGAQPACADGEKCCGSEGGCVAPTAQCPCGGTFCEVDQSCCGGACTDLTNDDANCGQCGRSCESATNPLMCAMSACTCGGVPCAADCCDGNRCVDLQSDEADCGACGNACAAGERCSAGKCQCGTGPACGPGSLCCQDACVPESASNCGTCGRVCEQNEACLNHACVCPNNGNQHCATGRCCMTAVCPQIETDNLNCGGCGVPCTQVGYSCVGGMCTQTGCTAPCPAGETCVGTVCKCGSNPTCGAGQQCCSGTCYDTASDNAHCGGCATSCTNGNQCMDGMCKCGSGAACPAGVTCSGGSCLSPNGAPCSSGTTCTSGICDPMSGVCCNAACGACKTCATGTCTAAPNGPDGRCNLKCQTGQCASGACQVLPTGTFCCFSATVTGSCNASGTCLQGQACPMMTLCDKINEVCAL
jgi:hypothetical protein